MSCAKAKVACAIVSTDGQVFMGRNDCENPQSTCPREEGEGYDKCKSICQQEGHAEIMALKKAGAKSIGGRAYLWGHESYCHACENALLSAGVKSLSLINKSKHK